MKGSGANALMHAARVRVVLAVLGKLALVLAVLGAVPAIVAGATGEMAMFQRLLAVSLALALLGAPLSRLGTPSTIQWNEALAVTGLAFTLAAAVMVWPLTSAGMSPLDAWFETVSAITTTGLSMLTDLEERPAAVLFLRAWMQWYGGLGIAAMTVALIMRHHASARRLLETTGETLTESGAREHARTVFMVYLLLTLAAIAAVTATGLAPFEATLYALSAVATGGFAPHDDSLASLPGSSMAAISLFCLLGAISLPLYGRAVRRGPGVIFRDPEFRALVLVVLATTALLALSAVLLDGTHELEALGTGAVLAVSAQTDTGFSPVQLSSLSPAAQVVLMVSMTLGGCTGSTAGGLKLIRLLILLRLIQVALWRTAAPDRAVFDVRIGGERVESSVLSGALVLLGLWTVVVLVSWMAFLFAGQPPMPSLFEVVSATANAGLSVGLTGTELPPALKAILSLDMLFGRVEVLALLVVLYPPTWIGRRQDIDH
ncbi:TrkH family potassium uptake protein [Imhoffiella purpurea]|uniref:Cation transporter n=1 Tax=Imhoffiella purpurea TaxID=1249627 RepID=W9VWL6_9GAMM|nr:potassium transporter TrkG [Imhoffiella purpurea]EXJ14805.1 cation transporter [Imhoffiella purpurea]